MDEAKMQRQVQRAKTWNIIIFSLFATTTVIGLLLCLICLYLISDVWLVGEMLEVLPTIGVYGFPIGLIVTLIGLFKKQKN